MDLWALISLPTRVNLGTLMRIRRRWKIALVAVLTGMVVLAVAVVSFLNSPIAARQAARILGSKLGARVEIAAVSVGFSGTTVSGVRVFEPGVPPAALPFLKVASVEADTSLCSLVTGRVIPNSVVLRKPAIQLRFAADGRVATRFPQPPGGGGDGGGGDIPLPAVRVEGASVSILQDGKPEASLSGIDLHSRGESRGPHRDRVHYRLRLGKMGDQGSSRCLPRFRVSGSQRADAD